MTKQRVAGLGSGCILLCAAACSETAEIPPAETVQVEPPAPVPTCAEEPASGAVLVRDESRGTGPHTVSIKAASTRTIVNIRDWETNDLVLSYFILPGEEGAVTDVPDGDYRIQYAFGDALGEDCTAFTEVLGASEDPEKAEFPVGSAFTLSYELTPAVGGNFQAQDIDASAFTAE